MNILLGFLLVMSALFLILIVLVQRGRGGGLTGALGGAGGQSAFGAKAGDIFTRITIGAAAVWIILCVVTVKVVGSGSDPLNLGGANVPAQGEMDEPAPFTPGTKGTEKGGAATGEKKATPAAEKAPATGSKSAAPEDKTSPAPEAEKAAPESSSAPAPTTTTPPAAEKSAETPAAPKE